MEAQTIVGSENRSEGKHRDQGEFGQPGDLVIDHGLDPEAHDDHYGEQEERQEP